MPTRNGLTRYRLFQVSAQIPENLLLTLLIVLPRMNFAHLQENSTQSADALLGV